MRKVEFMNTNVSSPIRRLAAAMVGGAVVSLILLSACKKEEETKPIVTVQTVVVQRTDLVQTVETEAILFPIEQAAITPKVSAPVKEFKVNRGSRVKKGQLLAVLENQDLSAAATENRGGLDQAMAAYSSATRASLPEEWKKAELDASAVKQMLDAEQKLYSSREELYRQGALPRKELDQAGVSLTQARNQFEIAQQHVDALHAVAKQDQLKSARGQLDAARGKFQGAEAQLSYSEIHSPIDGIVAERPLYAGETAAAGTPLIVVVDSSSVIAKAHLPQEQAALVKVGNTAEIAVAGEDKPVEGKVSVVSPAVDANSTTVEIWVQAANPEGRLRPGTSAHVSIAVAKFAGATVVPAESVLTSSDGKTTVMVVGKDNVAHQTEVKVGACAGKSVQINDGVKPGDIVVGSGAYGLPDGAKVQAPQPEKGDKPGEKAE
jgi:RND family efflux transporter MFP subunit